MLPAVLKKAFTMIELIFVIVIIGILAGIAVPKLAVTRDDAFVSRARSAVETLRAAISMERQKRILRGDFSDINGSAARDLLEYGLSDDWLVNGDVFIFTAPNGGTCIFRIDHNMLLKEKDRCHVPGMSDL